MHKKQLVARLVWVGTNLAKSSRGFSALNKGDPATMAKSVLVYEPSSSNLPYMGFILSLGQVDCTHARTPEEAHNWLEAAENKVVYFDLVVIGSLCHQGIEDAFLAELPGLSIPLVFVQRDADSALPALGRQQILCHPDRLLGCLRSLLLLDAS